MLFGIGMSQILQATYSYYKIDAEKYCLPELEIFRCPIFLFAESENCLCGDETFFRQFGLEEGYLVSNTNFSLIRLRLEI